MKPSQLKICCEAKCGHIYAPDNAEGKCPRCNSEGIWLSVMLTEEKDNDRRICRWDIE